MIDTSTKQALVIVDWNNFAAFYERCKCPESLLFIHDLKKAAYNEVETLAVANLHIAVGVSCADTLNCLDNFLAEVLL